MKRFTILILLLITTFCAYGETFRSLESRAKKGIPGAQYELGLWYYTGNKVDQDYVKAAEWFGYSALQDYSQAQFMLGTMYLFGEGVLKDSNNGVIWLEKSAEQGNPEAQFNLGYMYYYGIEVTKDIDKAMSWLKMAYDKGYQKAVQFWEKESLTSPDN